MAARTVVVGYGVVAWMAATVAAGGMLGVEGRGEVTAAAAMGVAVKAAMMGAAD